MTRIITPPYITSTPSLTGRLHCDEKELLEPNLLIPGKKPIGPVVLDRSNSLTNKIVGCWLLDRPGNSIRDYVHDSFAPYDSGTPTWIIDGHVGPGVKFSDGEPRYFSAGNNTDYNCLDAITIFCIASISSKSEPRTLLSKGIGGSPDHQWDLKYHNTPNRMRGSFRSSSTQVNIDGATSPALNEIYSHALTWDDADDNGYIYLNGKQEGSETFAGPIQTKTNNVHIGLPYTGTTVSEFAGNFYFAALWNRRLSASEIMALHLDPYQFLEPA